ncbi:MAG: alpha/beta hydrolase [Pseudomonadota bacterium]
MPEIYDDKTWVSEDGLTLNYRDYPARSDTGQLPIICLHGLTRNARDFESLAAHLSETRRVIVPDMRGRGKSEYAPSPDTYKPKQYVEDVELLLGEAGISRFISIGTSMGGIMTMLLAANDPDRIAGAVLNDIGPVIEPAGLERIGGYVGQGRSYPTWVHAARSLSETHGDAFPDYDLDQWLELAKRYMVVSQSGRISYDYDMAIAEPFSEADNAAPPNLWLPFEALGKVPMLLVRGELSDLISDDTIKQMSARCPLMSTITVARVGHAPTLDESEVRAAIATLLDSLS